MVGFGATTAILWEIVEYVAFIRNSSELDTAYVDTLGDLTLGLTGSTVAGVIGALAAGRRDPARLSTPMTSSSSFGSKGAGLD